ncbi:Tropinone reductase-like protein [Raphanus sativus]|nr:Tropinone reductase-like protein [Raphanus sativus]
MLNYGFKVQKQSHGARRHGLLLSPVAPKASGRLLVEELAMLGARVHACARDETQLQESLLEWQAKGFQVTTSVCDVSSRVQREKLMENRFPLLFQGNLNILVNNAGTCITKSRPQSLVQKTSRF